MSHYQWILIFLLSLLSLAVTGCEDTAVSTPLPITITTPLRPQNVIPHGDRILSMDVTESSGDNYEADLNAAQDAGVSAVTLTVYWDEIETASGVYNPDPNWLEIADLYYPTQDVGVSLIISVIDTNNIRLPSDLAGKPFSDPQVIERFKRLLDYVAAQIPEITLVTMTIGNEIDIYLGDDQEGWEAYETFFSETAVHARTLWPDIPIGSKTTFDGISGSAAPYIQSLNQFSDAVFVTYYPLDSDFHVRPGTAVHDDLQTLAAAFPNKPIYLLEVGYPSGADNNSSYAQQAGFIHELFQAWDTHAAQIPLLNYTWLTDMPPESVKELTDYYHFDDPGFASYLATLGLRTHAGQNKPAFDQWTAEAQARTWITTP